MRRAPLMMTAIAALGLIFTSGCTRREDKVLIEELRSENARLSSELNGLQKTATDLENERNFVRDENRRLREQVKGMEVQLRQNVGSLAPSLDTGVITTNESGDALIISQDVAFALGSAELNPRAKAAIKQLASQLNQGEYAKTFITVEGHTDNTPVRKASTIKKFGDNWGLSAMRAAAVIRELQAQGISPSRLNGAFKGEYQPLDRSNKAKNRRVEIFLSL